jgi:hypothetical protein
VSEQERSNKQEHRFYSWFKGPAESVKIGAQMVIGFAIVVILLGKLVLHMILPFCPNPGWILPFFVKNDPLTLIGYALVLSAGVELAYMLFTPGPDEALDPLILGLAAAALLVLSRLKGGRVTWEIGFTILVITLALGFMFSIRHRYGPPRELNAREKPGEGAREASNEESEGAE